MLVVLSPAKKLNFDDNLKTNESTEPTLISRVKPLRSELKKLSTLEIKKLMNLSDNLSELNFSRFQVLGTKKSPKKQAIYAFDGDTYSGLEAETFSKTDLKSAQKKIRILSGLYGVLRPLDLIEPYRLEMGTKFKFKSYNNLYDYWKEDVTSLLNEETKSNDYLINCASNEYFKVIDEKALKAKVITPVFKELRDGKYKIISFSAKKARGMMANYIVKNKVKKVEELKNFNLDGYKYKPSLSSESELVFVR